MPNWRIVVGCIVLGLVYAYLKASGLMPWLP